MIIVYLCVEQQLGYQGFFSWHLFKMRLKMAFSPTSHGKLMGFTASSEGQFIANLDALNIFLRRDLFNRSFKRPLS